MCYWRIWWWQWLPPEARPRQRRQAENQRWIQGASPGRRQETDSRNKYFQRQEQILIFDKYCQKRWRKLSKIISESKSAGQIVQNNGQPTVAVENGARLIKSFVWNNLEEFWIMFHQSPCLSSLLVLKHECLHIANLQMIKIVRWGVALDMAQFILAA